MSSRRWLVCVAAGAALFVTVGCGPDGPDIGYVEGTVTLGGQPLEDALVMFTPAEGGRPAAGRTNAEGYYELIYTQGRMGALPGEHTVTISTYQEGDPDEGIAKVPERVPARYNVHTELKETVKAGNNEINFELSSEGEIIEPTDEE